MCDPNMLGKEKIEEIILPMIGVKVEKEEDMFNFDSSAKKKPNKRKKDKDKFELKSQTLKDIWEALCKDD